jgi:hypothetical protein
LKKVNRRKWVTLITAAIVLTALTALIVRYINQPAQGQIVNSQPITSAQAASTFNMTPVKVSGSYVSFSYPAALSPLPPSSSSTGAALENYSFNYSDSPESWLLSVTVNKLSIPSLNVDSNYALRVKNQSQYSVISETVGNNKFIIYSDLKSSGFSKVAFTINGLKSADISMIGADLGGSTNIQNSFNLVLKTFSWK